MTWQYSTINYLDRVVICYYTTSVIVFNQIPDRGGQPSTHIATLFTNRQQRTTRGVAPPRWPGSRPHWGQLIIQRENRAKPCGGRHLSSLAGQAFKWTAGMECCLIGVKYACILGCTVGEKRKHREAICVTQFELRFGRWLTGNREGRGGYYKNLKKYYHSCTLYSVELFYNGTFCSNIL